MNWRRHGRPKGAIQVGVRGFSYDRRYDMGLSLDSGVKVVENSGQPSSPLRAHVFGVSSDQSFLVEPRIPNPNPILDGVLSTQEHAEGVLHGESMWRGSAGEGISDII